MQIVLKSNFDVAGVFGREIIEVQESTSVRALLEHLSQQCRLKFIDPESGRLNVADFNITLNGEELLSHRLDILLRETDEVRILLMALGGG